MKIFVAGATGVLGRMLVPLLVKAGHEVVGMTRDPAKQESVRRLGAWPVVVDVFDREALAETLQSERPDAVVHQLTSLNAADYAGNNRIRIEGTRNLVDAARAAGVERIVAQSYCLYAPGEGPAHEDDPLDTRSGAFARSIEGVLALEKAVSEVPEGVILRYGTLYGPGTWFDRYGPITERIRRGEFAATDDVTSFVHVEDAARAALLALSWPRGRVNIVDDEPAPGVEWVPVLAGFLEAPAPPIHTGTGSRQRGVSNDKARHELGWQPVYPSWREGFQIVLGAVESAQPVGR